MTNTPSDGLYYLVLAEFVGSTRFAARNGNAAFSVRIVSFVEAAKIALKNAKTTANSGEFIKAIGDGVLLAFRHFPDVVQWQMEFHGALLFASSRQERLRARTCVHAGEIRLDEFEPSALAVNHLFKLEKKVRPDACVLTETAHKLAVSSVYAKQIGFRHYAAIFLDGWGRESLYLLIVRRDLGFLMEKERRVRQFRGTF